MLRTSALALLLLAGCSGSAVDTRAVDPTQERLVVLARAYGRAAGDGKAPKSFADLAPFLETPAAIDEISRSPRDGKPFVVLWGTKFTDPQPKVYIFETDGKNGHRFVALTDGGTREVSDEQFQTMPKAK